MAVNEGRQSVSLSGAKAGGNAMNPTKSQIQPEKQVLHFNFNQPTQQQQAARQQTHTLASQQEPPRMPQKAKCCLVSGSSISLQAVVVAVSLTLCVLVFVFASQEQANVENADFDFFAGSVARTAVRAVVKVGNDSQLAASMLSGWPNVSWTSFQRVADQLGRVSVGGDPANDASFHMLFSYRVTSLAERLLLEQQARVDYTPFNASLFSNLTMRQAVDPQSYGDPVMTFAPYLPVVERYPNVFVFPVKGNEKYIMSDALSVAPTRESIMLAKALGQTVLSPRRIFSISTRPLPFYAIAFSTPVYRAGSPAQAGVNRSSDDIIGFSRIRIDVAGTVIGALSLLPARSMRLQIVDITSSSPNDPPTLMFDATSQPDGSWVARGIPLPDPGLLVGVTPQSGSVRTDIFRIGGRMWKTIVTPGPDDSRAVFLNSILGVVLFTTALLMLVVSVIHSVFFNYRTHTMLKEKIDLLDALQQAHAIAEHANLQKTNFLCFVCHELRNPLHAIIASADEMLDAQKGSPPVRVVSSTSSSTPPDANQNNPDVDDNQHHNQHKYHSHNNQLNPTSTHSLHSILSASQLMLAIVNDVLDMSKIESGNMQMECIAIDVRQLVKLCVLASADVAQSKGLHLLSFIDQRVPAVLMGDPFRIRQILTNFLSNSLKFTRQGSVRLSVTVAPPSPAAAPVPLPAAAAAAAPSEDRRMEGDGDSGGGPSQRDHGLLNALSSSSSSSSSSSPSSPTPPNEIVGVDSKQTKDSALTTARRNNNNNLGVPVMKSSSFGISPRQAKMTATGAVSSLSDSDRCVLEFTVEDTGIGIPENRIPHLFQAYTQAKLSTAREHGGTGLGLAIVKAIVDRLGGSIRVVSKEGKGTSMTVALPLLLPSPDHDDSVDHLTAIAISTGSSPVCPIVDGLVVPGLTPSTSATSVVPPSTGDGGASVGEELGKQSGPGDDPDVPALVVESSLSLTSSSSAALRTNLLHTPFAGSQSRHLQSDVQECGFDVIEIPVISAPNRGNSNSNSISNSNNSNSNSNHSINIANDGIELGNLHSCAPPVPFSDLYNASQTETGNTHHVLHVRSESNVLSSSSSSSSSCSSSSSSAAAAASSSSETLDAAELKTIAVDPVVEVKTKHSPHHDAVTSSSSSSPSPDRLILIVDDQQINRSIAARMVAQLVPGAVIHQAANGLEALYAVQDLGDKSHREYDIVLMDVCMPVMNGHDASRQLRERGFRAPIVAVTANAMVEDMRACIDAGMTTVVCKPFRKPDLGGVMQKLVPSLFTPTSTST